MELSFLGYGILGLAVVIGVILSNYLGFIKEADLTKAKEEMNLKFNIKTKELELDVESFKKHSYEVFIQKSFCNLRHNDLEKTMDKMSSSINRLADKQDENYKINDAKLDNLTNEIMKIINR